MYCRHCVEAPIEGLEKAYRRPQEKAKRAARPSVRPIPSQDIIVGDHCGPGSQLRRAALSHFKISVAVPENHRDSPKSYIRGQKLKTHP